jgi:hypothetical protein
MVWKGKIPMRSLLLTTLIGSFIAFTTLAGQSLTEHAAAAAGATIGTAAGKPLGGALGKVFGEVEKSPSTAAPRTVKPTAAKPEPAGAPKATEHPFAAGGASGGGGGGGGNSAAGGSAENTKTARSHRESNRRDLPAPPPPSATPIVAEPVVTTPVIKEPSAQDVASVPVGATSSELRQTLGTPESTVSIPGEDGHLLEIRQYWANGELVGTVRLDNGRVVSVRPNN